MDKEKTGKFIADLRKGKKLTQEEIGEKFGITSQSVSKWERGVNFPDLSIMKELSQILGVTMEEICDGESKRSEL